MELLPLLPDSGMDTIVAYRGATPVRRSDFLADVHAIAASIPQTDHVLNLCRDRYWFAAALFACISRGKLGILPNSAAPEIVSELIRELPDLVCLGDQPSIAHPLPYLQVSTLEARQEVPFVPLIPADRAIVHVYTSGSTGKPKAHVKTFGRICSCAKTEAARMWAVTKNPCAVLGTVPFQHMYGLESTIFLPLLGGGMLSSPLPFFPADVADALEELPEPRLLVTTPFHLGKLVESGIEFPEISAIVSATAPLSGELAREAEQRLGAPILEIYGSTETGQIATRRPTGSPRWEVFDGVSLCQERGATIASGGHLEGPQILQDILELEDEFHFHLVGRNSDMVNVAGKRSSLAYLNRILAGIPGVRDGVFCIPDPEGERGRLAAFVVAQGLSQQDIQSSLLGKLDPVFLPRPVVFLESLPRDGNGKMRAAVLEELIARHIHAK
ncbi:MAG: acyl-CoA synthetase [Burkholderiales bacterium]|nr:acyl-CoA synthetase [Burkholderiales bacterium]